MALTDQERARLRSLWRELARQTRLYIADPTQAHAEFHRLVSEATKWAAPMEAFADAFMLFGFARQAQAIAKTRVADFGPRARVVAAVAEMVADILGAEPQPPQLPFRADIDG